MNKMYNLSVFYFIIFGMLLLISAFMIFYTKIGLNFDSITTYYSGSKELFIQPKTVNGFLKIAYPHIFSFALFGMVILHFLVFSKYKSNKNFRYLILVTFFTMFLEIFVPLFIIFGAEVFAYVKLFSFFLLFTTVLYIFWIILDSIANQNSLHFLH